MQLTQQDLADAAGTGRRFISELETGKATLELGKVIQACSVLGVDLFATGR
jgi:y4mF family transcriptional regulator